MPSNQLTTSGGEYKLSAQLNPQSSNGLAVNCLLFLQDASLLVVRLWDLSIGGGRLQQELRDPQWGQITALSWLSEKIDKSPVLLIGTGRGVVSTYPFSNDRTQFIRQASTSTAVFMLDDSVEVQTLDPVRSSGSATLSADGSIKAVHNLTTGNFDVYDPPDAATPVTTLMIPTDKTSIKQCVFTGESNNTLGQMPSTLLHWLVISAQAFSTPDYHFIAAGESEEPASIYVWKKPASHYFQLSVLYLTGPG
ncbi:hypothetical protein C8R46DRAFT_1030634 [Mycena filopes]|nr:hypothetical protein C8R46DRAFT_1030634 [Mycena filopes]